MPVYDVESLFFFSVEIKNMLKSRLGLGTCSVLIHNITDSEKKDIVHKYLIILHHILNIDRCLSSFLVYLFFTHKVTFRRKC